MPETSFKAISLAPAVASPILSVIDELCVRILTYPVIFKLLIVLLADKVESLAPVPTPSKNTSSVETGTDELSCVFEAEPQFVLEVAFQFTLAPPPTQYLDALCKSKSSATYE